MNWEQEGRRQEEQIQDLDKELENISDVLMLGGFVFDGRDGIQIVPQKNLGLAVGGPIQESPPVTTAKRTPDSNQFVIPAYSLRYYYYEDGSRKVVPEKDEKILQSTRAIILKKLDSLQKARGVYKEFPIETFFEDLARKTYQQEQTVLLAPPLKRPPLTSVADLEKPTYPRLNKYTYRDIPLLMNEQVNDTIFSPRELEQIEAFVKPGSEGVTGDTENPQPGIMALQGLLPESVSADVRRFTAQVCFSLVKRLTKGDLFFGPHAISFGELSDHADLENIIFKHGISRNFDIQKMLYRTSDLRNALGHIRMAYIVEPHFAKNWTIVQNGKDYSFIAQDGEELVSDRGSFLVVLSNYIRERFQKAGYIQAKDYHISPLTIAKACIAECIRQEEQRSAFPLGENNFTEGLADHLHNPESTDRLEGHGINELPVREVVVYSSLEVKKANETRISESRNNFTDSGSYLLDPAEEIPMEEERKTLGIVPRILRSRLTGKMEKENSREFREYLEKFLTYYGIPEKFQEAIKTSCTQLVNLIDQGVIFIDVSAVPFKKYAKDFNMKKFEKEYGESFNIQLLEGDEGIASYLQTNEKERKKYKLLNNRQAWISEPDCARHWKKVRGKKDKSSSFVLRDGDNERLWVPHYGKKLFKAQGYLGHATDYLYAHFPEEIIEHLEAASITRRSMITLCFSRNIENMERKYNLS